MDSEEPPKLQHAIPSPESYLPGTPEWFWWMVAIGGAMVLFLLFWLFRLLKPAPKPPRPPERNLFEPALRALDELENEADRKLVSEIAAGASLAIRTYLADARSEPALYETVEEFQARHSVLPAGANRLLNELNEVKYAKSEINGERSLRLVKQTRERLKLLHARPDPEPEAPPVLPPKADPRKRLCHGSIVVVPLALMTAIATFLPGLYDGPDTGAGLTLHPLTWDALTVHSATWISLGVALVALLVHLITRSQP